MLRFGGKISGAEGTGWGANGSGMKSRNRGIEAAQFHEKFLGDDKGLVDAPFLGVRVARVR